VFEGAGHFIRKFQVEEDVPTNHLCTVSLDRPVNAFTLPLKVFTQRNFVADCLRNKSIFVRKTATLRCWTSLWGFRGSVRCLS